MNTPSRKITPAARGFDRYLPEGSSEPRHAETAGQPLFDIASVRAMAWRQKWVLVGVTLAGLLAGFVYTLLLTPMYQATATVRVSEAGFIVEGQDLADPYIAPSMMFEYMQTQLEVIQSRSMAQRVARSMGLDENPSRLPGAQGAKVMGKEAALQLAANVLQGGISAETQPDTRIIALTFKSSDPGFAARAANAFSESYMVDNIDQSVEANSYAQEYLASQIDEIRKQLSEAEVQAIQYARANRIVGQPIAEAGGEGDEAGTAETLTAANLVDINQSYTQARARRIQTEQRWRAVAGIPATQLPEVQSNATIQSLKTSLAAAQSRLADLQERYRDDFPAVRETSAEIASLNSQLAATAAEIKSGIRNEFLIAQRQEAGLQGEVNRVSDATLDEQDRRVEYNQIAREVSALRTQLATLLERYNQIASAANLKSSRVTKLDDAIVPGAPFSPNLLKNLLVALVLGGGVAFLVALLRETLDDRLRSIEDVERKLGLPALGQTPWVGEDVEHEIDDAFTPISEAYSSIRASLDFALLSSEQKVLQFTSSQPSEGKTTSCAAIARKYAMVGKRVLLVDMDIRRPSMQRIFGTQRPASGLVDVLHGRATISEALIPLDVENLDVMPVGTIPPNPVEILSSGLVAEFFERARAQYDVVMVDSSPVLGIADAPLLSRFVDAVVFVVEANRSPASQTRAAVRRLEDMGANLVGTIVTKYRALEAGQSYDYQYRYYTYNAES